MNCAILLRPSVFTHATCVPLVSRTISSQTHRSPAFRTRRLSVYMRRRRLESTFFVKVIRREVMGFAELVDSITDWVWLLE